MERRTFKPGERLFIEGEAGHEAFIIETGQVEICKKAGGDETCVLNVCGRGDMIGEMALIDDAPRMATARATQETVAVVVPKTDFERRLGNTDPVVRRVLNIVVGRLRDQTGRVMARHRVVR